jgi:hypothetical protein
MTAALSQREPSKPDPFIGQVFRRASPILTWRPALEARAERERVARANVQELSGASLLEDRESFRFSRAPTRKMIAWPIVPRLRRETPRGDARRKALRTVGGLVAAFTLLILAGAIATGAWAMRAVARPEPPAARVLAAHILDERVDTLAPAPVVAAAPTPAVASQLISQSPQPPQSPPPAKPSSHSNQRGRAHHGHRPTASTKH